jgi:outer membrane protein assembly factor BamB
MRLFSGLWLPCLLLNVVSVLAIFKDDAYHTDWHIPLIGPSIAASTFFHRPNADSRASLIYTLTTRSIVAAINPKDGELVWRQQLAESDGNGIARGGNGIIVSATGNGVASFDAGNGRLVWENQFSSKILDLGVTTTNSVVVLFEDGSVRLLGEQDGDVKWEWKFLDRCVARSPRPPSIIV